MNNVFIDGSKNKEQEPFKIATEQNDRGQINGNQQAIGDYW